MLASTGRNRHAFVSLLARLILITVVVMLVNKAEAKKKKDRSGANMQGSRK